MSDITEILNRLNSGEDPKAYEALLDSVYRELHQIAEAKMREQGPGQTLQATILVHDVWLKLCPDGNSPHFAGRGHFFAAAAKTMHDVLVDHVRRKNALKRGKRTELTDTQLANLVQKAPDDLILAVDEALTAFSKTSETTAKLIELRFFLGLSMQEAAEALGIPLRTAERNYTYFKAWFQREFKKRINTDS